MTPLLSILIPTVIGREANLTKLLASINSQITLRAAMLFEKDGYTFDGEFDCFQPVEVIWLKDDKKMSIGEKRERLYKVANGKYAWQVDDDDDIAENAVWDILKALEVGPDVVTFKEQCWINGIYCTSNHSSQYEDWAENQDGFDYVRTPFMKSVIKTEIARSVPIPHVRFGEDHEWARSLKPYLKTEIHIDKELYFYQHNSKPEDFLTRYGFDRD